MTKNQYEILRRPLVTEKGHSLREDQNQYVFEVAMAANKVEIRRAVEKIFDVRVEEVRTMIVRGDNKRVGRNFGRLPNWKKAIVRLRPGNSIEVFEGV